MFEPHSQPLLPIGRFWSRLLRHFVLSLVLLAIALGIGVVGYRELEGLSWVDAILNASMILGGMGPVSELHTAAGKLFASVYALFSGVFVIALAGLLFAPVFHRFLHAFHLESEETNESET